MEVSKNRFVHINLRKIERELTDQPVLFKQYADELAEAKRYLAEAKAFLDVTRAVVEKRIRNNPGKYGIKSVREKAIELEATIHPKVKAAVQDVINAKEVVDILEGSTRALEHKKSSLEELTKLLLSDFWSPVRLPKETDDEVKKHVRRKGRRPRE